MSGYAASARIVRVSPRLIDRGAADRATDRRSVPSVEAVLDDGVILGDGDPITLGERWDRFRDRWSQLTFYLTDPESWR